MTHSRRLAWFVCCALPLAAVASARSRTETFRLSVGLQGLSRYFPGMLGNGEFATLTGPRGTEPTETFVAGLMDRTPGDIARPARIPGWNGIDFSPGRTNRHAWLNASPLSARHFTRYRQTLDLRAATLATRFRYADRGRSASVRVLSLVSEAEPHLAAIRLTLTPRYSGWARLSFPLSEWPQHAPRFALARLSGPQLQRLLAARGVSLQARPPATPDRAALWYPGYVAVRRSGAATRTLTAWIDGRAAYGDPMAMAEAVALPSGADVRSIAVRRGPDSLSLEVTLRVVRNRRYRFVKYVAISGAGWGGTAAQDAALARAARSRGFEALLARQRAAWRALWRRDIVIRGDPHAQQVAHSELYYLLANTRPDGASGIGPCGLTLCYAGHVFWDSDTWMFPALLLLHPRRARSMLAFRERTLPAAERRARAHGFAGAMYPWESDPQYGTDQTPDSAHVLADTEIHVNADVAIAQWQYYLATLDRTWLRTRGWPVIRAVARFFASRASRDTSHHRYEILHVTSVSEAATDIANDTFTNSVAARALAIATAAADVLGVRPDPAWRRISRDLYIPLASDGAHHLAFGMATEAAGRGKDFGGGPLPLLFLPALDVRMPARLRRGDYAYAIGSNPQSSGAVSMGILPKVAAADAAGRTHQAVAWLRQYLTGGTLKPPFNVRTETAANNVGPFLTGSGGYLQSLLFGLTGLRIRAAGLVAAYPPALPRDWRSLTLRDIHFRERRMDIRIARDAAGAPRLTRRTLP